MEGVHVFGGARVKVREACTRRVGWEWHLLQGPVSLSEAGTCRLSSPLQLKGWEWIFVCTQN